MRVRSLHAAVILNAPVPGISGEMTCLPGDCAGTLFVIFSLGTRTNPTMSEQAATQVILLSLQHAYALIRTQEDELGNLDAAAGDGDHGAALVRGLRAAVVAAEANVAVTPGELLALAGAAFADEGGGASGALVGSWIAAIGQHLDRAPTMRRTRPRRFNGLDLLCALGKAKPGDKTMIDALEPFVGTLKQGIDAGLSLAAAWQEALPAAVAGADATANMVARRGRFSTSGRAQPGASRPGGRVHDLSATGGGDGAG